MKIGIDIGASLTKIVFLEKDKIIKKIITESKNQKLDNYISNKKINQIYITGGNKKLYPEKIRGIKIIKKDEIQSITKGINEKNCIICSIGTGTCLVDVSGKGKHIGGTAIGGGTYRGLLKLLTDNDDIDYLNKISNKGNLKKIDLSIKDIIGSKIGILDSELTASNLGKIKNKNIKQEDLIKAIQNLIIESIFSTIYFASKYKKKKKIVFVGKMMEIKFIRQRIKYLCKKFKLDPIIPPLPAYTTALGATK